MAQNGHKIHKLESIFSIRFGGEGGGHTPGVPTLFALGFIPPPKISWLHPWILFYVHKDRTDRFNILTVANKAVDKSDNRKRVYGAFSSLLLETTLWQQNLKRHKKIKFYYPPWFTQCIEFWKKNQLYLCAQFFQNLDVCPPNNFCRGTSLNSGGHV